MDFWPQIISLGRMESWRMRQLKQALQDVVCILFSFVSFTFLNTNIFFDEISFSRICSYIYWYAFYSPGSLILEMGALSRLTGDPRFESAALRALRQLWRMRSSLDLLGTTLDVVTGEWLEYSSSIGAGMLFIFRGILVAIQFTLRYGCKIILLLCAEWICALGWCGSSTSDV